MDSILETLDTSDPKTLLPQFISILDPFSDFISLDPKPSSSSTTIKNPRRKKKSKITDASVRPLAKKFLPFLSKSLKLILGLLRRNPESQSQSHSVDDERAAELLKIYRLVLDCVDCISGCLVGNPNFVAVEKGNLICCLESWGKYGEAEEEGVSLLEKLKIEKGKVTEPETAMLAVKVVSSIINCAYKSRSKDGAVYARNLQLVDQVLASARVLDTELVKKYHTCLVNALCRCALFLARECISFDSSLVREFCLKTLTECLQSSSVDLFRNISRNICKSIDKSWDSRPFLILDILNITLEGSLCECKVGVVSFVNEFLQFVDYSATSLSSDSIDMCKGTSELLFKYGGDFLQVSPPVASVLFLYATGLYIKSNNVENKDSSQMTFFLVNERKLQLLGDPLRTLAEYFDTSSCSNTVFPKPEVRDSDLSSVVLGCMKQESSRHLHGNVSHMSYLDALEFICLVLVEYINTTWESLVLQEKAVVRHSDNITYIEDALLQYCDVILALFKCNKRSDRDRERLHDCRRTFLQVAVSALKISLRVSEDHKKCLSSFKSIISSEWIEPQELKYFISVLGNIGTSLFNAGQLEEASVALRLRCKTIWAYEKILCNMYKSKSEGSQGDGISENEMKTVIIDSFEKCASIVDVLHKCRAGNVNKIVVRSLVELSSGDNMFPNLSGSLALVKQWVKMLCRDFVDVDTMEKAPYLHSLLLSRCSTWPMTTLGRILEQELLAYGLMEAQNPELCHQMQLKVIDTLLEDIWTAKEYNSQRSRILIMKGRALRSRGIEGLNDCIKCLRSAISLLKERSGKPSINCAPIYNQLAQTYLLAAHCSQEANEDREVILQDIHKALEIWSSLDVQGHCSENVLLQLPAANSVQLLCSIVDLLSMKGCLELQFGICKQIVNFFKCGNVPLGRCLAILWSERRVSHSLCSFPVDENSILQLLQPLEGRANSVDFWIDGLKDHPSYLMAFLQKLSLSDSILPEQGLDNVERYFGSKVTIDEVKKVASSLISESSLSSQSASIAGYLYYDLSERLFSGGQLFEALSHARLALSLRKRMLQRSFKNNLHLGNARQNRQDNICFEIIGSVATGFWPDIGKSKELKNSILTPWSALRCYLESILQVGVINETIGNGAEAEVLFWTGKNISTSQDLPIFQITFTSLLGQLYRKNQHWDLAENELNCARNLLLENDTFISCKHCKLSLDVIIVMQFGDLYRNRTQKDSPLQFSVHALKVYQKALGKLNHGELESSLQPSMSFGKYQHRVLNVGKIPSTREALMLPECSICSSATNGIHHDTPMHMEKEEDEGSNIHMRTKKSSRIPSKCLQKEHNAGIKPKTRFSQRTLCRKSTNAVDSLGDDCARSANHDTLQVKLNGNSSTDSGCYKGCMSDNIKCWRCLLIKAMLAGTMQDIIYLKWESHRRRLLLRLLLKIAKCKGNLCRKNEAHEVHDEFWQCIYVMFSQNPLSHSNSDVSDCCFMELTQGECSREIFPVERAAMLYTMSWFFLKDCHSGHSRKKCCTLANIQLQDIIPWLLRAFILSRELPLLFQKVSKLLASLLLISTIDGPISEPFFSESSLSISHWAAYFHQASLGTYIPCQFLTCLKDNSCYTKASEDSFATILDTVIKASNFLRFAPGRLAHLEKFVREFFQGLPSVPIVCISILEGDYANLIGETLLLPSFLPAWMLLSRLNAIGQPIAMLLPVDRILEEVQLELAEWECPWGHSVVDHIAPVFKQIMNDNFLSINNTYTDADAKANTINWWSQRSRINNSLNKFLKSMEDSWLGPWSCLLLGEHLDPNHRTNIVTELLNELKLHCKFDANDSLVTAIVSGSKSVGDMEACFSQLLLYKGYFGRGACCGGERLRAFSNDCHKEICSLPESVYKHKLETSGGLTESADREPVILVLDSEVQMLPWESLPALRSQEVYRMPSVGSISFTLRRCSYYRSQNKALDAGFPLINPLDTYYLLNPSGDLNNTQAEFEQWFRNQNWRGEAGKVPKADELVSALRNHDLFLYFGHGSGMQYIPGKEIKNLDKCAATLLMGCSSGSLTYKGSYAPRGAPLLYLFAGSPAVISNLWEVTDRDIDRFGKAMVESWLQEEQLVALANCPQCQLVKGFDCLEIDDRSSATAPKARKKTVKSKKLMNSSDKGTCKVCGRKMIASFMSKARDACKLQFIIGASPVCYGVPTVIMKKS